MLITALLPFLILYNSIVMNNVIFHTILLPILSTKMHPSLKKIAAKPIPSVSEFIAQLQILELLDNVSNNFELVTSSSVSSCSL